jgi:hypothetical protein
LQTKDKRILYRLGSFLIGGLIFGLIYGLIDGLIDGLISGPFFGIISAWGSDIKTV